MVSTHDPPRFNLWSEPWITVERPSGALEMVSIEQLLLNTAVYRTLFDPSPLVVVSIHRLLTAILQDIFQPEVEYDLLDLWEVDAFPPNKIKQFGDEYAHRFDLFSEETPFLQSADIPLYPEKRGKGKAISELIQEQAADTSVTHYNHIYDFEHILCASCCSKGLLTIPTFSQPGGRGYSTSINGIPPIYVVPGGNTYYHSLVSSLLTPYFRPGAEVDDKPWWKHAPTVKKEEVLRLGYLHSLTFPARRVRLYPIVMNKTCSRCGYKTAWGAEEMFFAPGEYLPKDAPFWRDPFVAYFSKNKEQPIPIKPRKGRAVWRDYVALFLPSTNVGSFLRPSFIGQLNDEEIRERLPYGKTTPIPFQTFSLRIDKKKIFEWESNGFSVPPTILTNADFAIKIQDAITFAEECEYKALKRIYAQHFGGVSKQHPNATPIKGSTAVKNQMLQAYWQQLGDEFRRWIMRFTPDADTAAIFEDWLQVVIRTGIDVFYNAAKQLNTGTSTALICEEAVNHCRASLYNLRNKNYPKQEGTG
ncbi:MAG: type I-E CRISPR-associated protein Cse1/CasA [Chloroflexi bacterium]|nr:MAG: type I-E CRISPR-associated protein Cse1/CasA [Chloroflexota bacterium]